MMDGGLGWFDSDGDREERNRVGWGVGGHKWVVQGARKRRKRRAGEGEK